MGAHKSQIGHIEWRHLRVGGVQQKPDRQPRALTKSQDHDILACLSLKSTLLLCPAGVCHATAAPPGGDGSGGPSSTACVPAGPVDQTELPWLSQRCGVSVFDLQQQLSEGETHVRQNKETRCPERKHSS